MIENSLHALLAERAKMDVEFSEKPKKSVLQQAVQGCLVPQDPADEPAAALLERIRVQRAQLIKQKKIKNTKNSPITPAEVPFEIPDSWEWVRLGELCDYGRCINVNYEDVEAGVWNLDLEDIEKDTGIILRKKRKTVGEKGSTKHVFKKGMFLYSKLRPYLNKVVIPDEDGVCSSEILPLDFILIDNNYAQLLLMEPNFVEYAKECSYGVKMPRLGAKDAVRWLIPLPPLSEQKRICTRVQEIFNALD